MTPDEIRAFLHHHVENLGTHDLSLMVSGHAEDGVVESPSTGIYRGREEIKQNYERWTRAFPDLEFTIEEIIAEEGKAAAFVRLAGTHQGDFLGLPATGKRIEFRLVFLQKLANDQIVHERRIYDFSGLLIKLGILRVKPA